MMSRSFAGALVLALLSLAPHVFAFERETVPVAVAADGEIAVEFLRPTGQGPFPLVVLSHGAHNMANIRAFFSPDGYRKPAEVFVEAGFAVAVPIRRGYGQSRIAWAESYGPCERPHYYQAGMATAEDIRATVAALGTRADVRKDRVVLVGHSAGGWGSLAAAHGGIPGLAAVINFSGGRGIAGPMKVCDEPQLVAAAGRFGQGSQTPQLWIFAENDRGFWPALAEKMLAAFTAAGGTAELAVMPAEAIDGHHYIHAIEGWRARVITFLRRHVQPANPARSAAQ